ncbi:hypothetical protein [Halalkalibacter kiskunsagensis]|uniref:hypothetical protein n=1 Tax=Halalkalibacter kiskunsagensis TaxID=1548599 RepID=UPI00300960CC
MDLNGERYCVLIQVEQKGQEPIEMVLDQDVIQRFRKWFSNEEKDLIVRWGNGRFVMLISAE